MLTPQKRQQDCRTPKTSRYDLKRAACFGNFFLCGRAEGMRVNGKLCREFAIAKKLDGIGAAANEPVRAQQLWRYRFAGRKDVQFRKVQNRILDAERVVKAALRHAAMQRHLAAFKSAPARIAAAGFLSLVAGTGSFAQLGAHAAADAPLAMTRADAPAKIGATPKSEAVPGG